MTDPIPLAALGGATVDAVVVGAGPAGSMTALGLARRGARVLVVERRTMPRWKVCGTCVGAAGARTLERAGLGGLLGSIGALRLDRVDLCAGGRRASMELRGVSVVSRGALDSALLREAGVSGARTLTGVVAAPGPDGRVRLHRGAECAHVSARTIVVAGGLASGEAFGLGRGRVRDRSWIGLGVTDSWNGGGDESRALLMLVGRRGYLGRVRTQDGRANWAAAIDPRAVRASGGVVEAMRAVCLESGFDPELAPIAGWRGTPKLTRRGRAQSGTVYAVGDAAGYVEPITGEGISWALASGAALGEELGRALARGQALADWPALYRRMMWTRRARCAVVSGALRRTTLVGLGVRAMGACPRIGGEMVGWMIGGRAGCGCGSLA